MLSNLQSDLKKLSSPQKRKASEWFFKTGKDQYGFGDIFIGVTVPEQRAVAKKYIDLPLNDIKKLLLSKIHEERLVALILLVSKFEKADEVKRKEIYGFYLKHTKYVNNWDLVDTSAAKIMGEYLLDKPRDVLYKFAKSESIWERRIAIISTLRFILNKESKDTFKISEILLNDKHDLIHKAVGWMLRESGQKVSKEELEKFLNKNYSKMPRTMLRYAIEKLPEEKRQMYLKRKKI
jgi:3-methyladenine DNA glycosylase AlkD